jgi:hypothetical protein
MSEESILGDQTPAEPPVTEPAPAPAPEQTPPAQPEPQTGYEPFAVPEGYQQLDDAGHAELTALGQELKLDQKQMQKLVDYGSKKIGDGMEAMRLEAIRRWRAESEADPAIREGLPHAMKLMNRFGNDDVRTVLNQTGAGNHPALIKFFAEMGRALGEAPFYEGRKPNAPGAEVSLLSGFAERYKGKMEEVK